MATYEERRQEFEKVKLILRSIIEAFGREAKAAQEPDAKEAWTGHGENAKDVLGYLDRNELVLTGGDTQAYVRTTSGR